jgi:hypothetical protein
MLQEILITVGECLWTRRTDVQWMPLSGFLVNLFLLCLLSYAKNENFEEYHCKHTYFMLGETYTHTHTYARMHSHTHIKFIPLYVY